MALDFNTLIQAGLALRSGHLAGNIERDRAQRDREREALANALTRMQIEDLSEQRARARVQPTIERGQQMQQRAEEEQAAFRRLGAVLDQLPLEEAQRISRSGQDVHQQLQDAEGVLRRSQTIEQSRQLADIPVRPRPSATDDPASRLARRAGEIFDNQVRNLSADITDPEEAGRIWRAAYAQAQRELGQGQPTNIDFLLSAGVEMGDVQQIEAIARRIAAGQDELARYAGHRDPQSQAIYEYLQERVEQLRTAGVGRIERPAAPTRERR